MNTLEPSNAAERGRISFVGAGPGAADLITLRAARRLAEADIVVWSPTLISPDGLREHIGPEAELVDSSRVGRDELMEVYRRAFRDRRRVVRLHSGDPALWGAVQQQYDACQRLGLEVEIVPGVSEVSATAAVLGREIAPAEDGRPVVLTRLDGPENGVREFARPDGTLAVFLAAARAGQLVEELRAAGYPEDTPIVVAYKVSWPDEQLVHATVATLEDTVKQQRLWRHALFLVGEAVRSTVSRPRPYATGPARGYRSPAGGVRRSSTPSRSGTATPPGSRTGSQRPDGKSDAEAAWWAVRNWQETARTNPRMTPVRVRTADQADQAVQDGLFDGTAAPSGGAAAAAASAPPRVTARVTPREEPATSGEPVQPEPPKPKPPRTRAGRKAPAKPRTSTARKTTKRKPTDPA